MEHINRRKRASIVQECTENGGVFLHCSFSHARAAVSKADSKAIVVSKYPAESAAPQF